MHEKSSWSPMLSLSLSLSLLDCVYIASCNLHVMLPADNFPHASLDDHHIWIGFAIFGIFYILCNPHLRVCGGDASLPTQACIKRHAQYSINFVDAKIPIGFWCFVLVHLIAVRRMRSIKAFIRFDWLSTSFNFYKWIVMLMNILHPSTK